VLFAVRRLSRHHRQGSAEVDALRDVSFNIRERDYVAVAGPSGGGKTTLLHVLGLLDGGFSGELEFCGEPVRGLDPAARARLRLSGIGHIFQGFHLLPMLSVRDNVALPHWRLHGQRRRARARAEELLASLGLEHRMTQRPARLSGGEQQRVAIARALINDPPVILADEPTGNLDAKSTRALLDHFDQLSAQGRALVVVSHNPDVVNRARRAIVLRHGRLTADVPVEQLQDPRNSPWITWNEGAPPGGAAPPAAQP